MAKVLADLGVCTSFQRFAYLSLLLLQINPGSFYKIMSKLDSMEKFLVRHAKERGRNVAFQGPGWSTVRSRFSSFCAFVTRNFPLLCPGTCDEH